jgi:hypothetical protein
MAATLAQYSAIKLNLNSTVMLRATVMKITDINRKNNGKMKCLLLGSTQLKQIIYIFYYIEFSD